MGLSHVRWRSPVIVRLLSTFTTLSTVERTKSAPAVVYSSLVDYSRFTNYLGRLLDDGLNTSVNASGYLKSLAATYVTHSMSGNGS